MGALSVIVKSLRFGGIKITECDHEDLCFAMCLRTSERHADTDLNLHVLSWYLATGLIGEGQRHTRWGVRTSRRYR